MRGRGISTPFGPDLRGLEMILLLQLYFEVGVDDFAERGQEEDATLLILPHQPAREQLSQDSGSFFSILFGIARPGVGRGRRTKDRQGVQQTAFGRG